LSVTDDLQALATAHGVARSYEDWQQRQIQVDPDVIRAVLRVLDVEADTPAAVRRELVRAREPKRPGTVVARPGELWRQPTARAVNGDAVIRELRQGSPVNLAPGWYRLSTGEHDGTLIVDPGRLRTPPPAWGWMLQLYALHSAGSWGMGDLADLRELVGWAARTGDAGVVLLNPMHAVATTPHVQASPYSPTSRRYVNPIYLSVRDLDAYQRADPGVWAKVDALRVPTDGDLIDYDQVWQAKREAFELLLPYAEPVGDIDADLRDFATFSALAEIHGPRWQDWPEELRRPEAPAVAAVRAELGDRVAFHAWLQRESRRQLARAQDTARASGMPIGLVHDLAVGVDPGGADGWMLQDVLAPGVHVGAPPDAFNQLGQDWGLAAWRPDRLADTGYAAYRDMLRAVLTDAGGVRVDHVMGLWRLWWIPPGASPDQGTYVGYDHEAMLAVLTLEAIRAGATVVAENLGTVEPRVTTALRQRNILGSEVLWFARDWAAKGQPFIPPGRWPAAAMASISTHDLPTAPGLLSGEHVRLRTELGLLPDPAEEARRAKADRAALVALLRDEGVVEPGASDEELVVAMHRLLARSPCRFLLASPYDVLGETRQPNLPGTVDQYPNWRLRAPLPLEAMRDDPRMHRVADVLGSARSRAKSS